MTRALASAQKFNMPPPIQPGAPWQPAELAAIVTDYFAMLALELAGQPYAKAAHHRALTVRIGRPKSAIEFKHQNISAILLELGLPWIPGYKPLGNYQQALLRAIERHLAQHPAFFAAPPRVPRLAAATGEYFAPAPSGPPAATPPPLQRLIRQWDPVSRDFRNRALGRAGEEFVVALERRRLAEAAREDLARSVRWVAEEDGDGAGYDVLSFHPDGRTRQLEVKTTNGPAHLPFYLTRNELSVAEANPASWTLYRVHLFADTPRIWELHPPLDAALQLTPETWRAQPR